jgi:cytochrome c-type biogenesis protein
MSWLTVATALWFGILTSISPCPLATNIAAISFVAKHTGRIHSVLLAGLLYAFGRMLAYLALGALIMGGLLAGGDIALFLQRYLNQVLGPALILVGMLLLGLLRTTASVHLVGSGIQHRAEKGGWLWSMLLGALFALSFCPVSAGLFFGVLIPLSAANRSIVLLPLIYGMGTAAPVIVFALLIAFASRQLGHAFDVLSHIERWVRLITGFIFVLAGVYYSLLYVYEMPIKLWY